MTTAFDICDAIAVDLHPLAPAARFRDWRYVEPGALTAEAAPWLAVFTPTTAHTLLATIDQYDDHHDLVVEWAVSASDEAEDAGEGLPALALEVENDLAPILARLKTYAAGVPSFDGQITAVLNETRREVGPAALYRIGWTLTIEQLPA